MCVYPFITLVSCSVYFGRAGFLGVFLAGRVMFSFMRGAPLCGVSGWYNLFECQPVWVAGLYRFFLSLGSVEAARYD